MMGWRDQNLLLNLLTVLCMWRIVEKEWHWFGDDQHGLCDMVVPNEKTEEDEIFTINQPIIDTSKWSNTSTPISEKHTLCNACSLYILAWGLIDLRMNSNQNGLDPPLRITIINVAVTLSIIHLSDWGVCAQMRLWLMISVSYTSFSRHVKTNWNQRPKEYCRSACNLGLALRWQLYSSNCVSYKD